MCKMDFEMISQMTPGNLVDYILSYNEFQGKVNGNDKKKGKVRLATQADFDNF